MTSNKTHGLMADRSHRDEQNGINLLRSKGGGDSRDQLLTNAALRLNPAHAGERSLGQSPNNAIPSQSAQGCERQDTVWITARVGQIAYRDV